jgi:3'-phosphoadenosine 5'-phosphosulfate sulfotransferase (PAPS reductase)/FAD synthetase
MKDPKQIIEAAVSQYNPVRVALLFSGGHDSLVSTHVSAGILQEMKVPFVVYHGDTTIGIEETQFFVKDVCANFGWELVIRQPPKEEDHYENIVANYGFPGATKSSHQYMYRRLKERALRHYVTHECKANPQSRENVLLLTGVRKDESAIRMAYSSVTTKDNSRVWSNPIFYWSEEKCRQYMGDNNLPKNPVKEKICISGECLCGSFGSNEELAEIQSSFPRAGNRIKELHALAKSKGFPWGWGSGPNDWFKNHPPGVLDMFTNEANPMPMCVGCENKRATG